LKIRMHTSFQGAFVYLLFLLLLCVTILNGDNELMYPVCTVLFENDSIRICRWLLC